MCIRDRSLTERVADVFSDHPVHHYPKHEAVDFYHRYPEYIELMKQAGFKAFRMSISWARIFPNGDDAQPNAAGIAYYRQVFEALHEAGITPIVTLSHYDMPLAVVQHHQGWYGRETIEMYVNYARTCFEPVSYTHLDVYKRQVQDIEQSKNDGVRTEKANQVSDG